LSYLGIIHGAALPAGRQVYR